MRLQPMERAFLRAAGRDPRWPGTEDRAARSVLLCHSQELKSNASVKAAFAFQFGPADVGHSDSGAGTAIYAAAIGVVDGVIW
jgi:hypothetical protein